MLGGGGGLLGGGGGLLGGGGGLLGGGGGLLQAQQQQQAHAPTVLGINSTMLIQEFPSPAPVATAAGQAAAVDPNKDLKHLLSQAHSALQKNRRLMLQLQDMKAVRQKQGLLEDLDTRLSVLEEAKLSNGNDLKELHGQAEKLRQDLQRDLPDLAEVTARASNGSNAALGMAAVAVSQPNPYLLRTARREQVRAKALLELLEAQEMAMRGSRGAAMRYASGAWGPGAMVAGGVAAPIGSPAWVQLTRQKLQVMLQTHAAAVVHVLGSSVSAAHDKADEMRGIVRSRLQYRASHHHHHMQQQLLQMTEGGSGAGGAFSASSMVPAGPGSGFLGPSVLTGGAGAMDSGSAGGAGRGYKDPFQEADRKELKSRAEKEKARQDFFRKQETGMGAAGATSGRQ